MQQIALYYPLIRPSEAWLKSSLLLFDKVSTILPRYTELDATLEWLRSENLWIPSYVDSIGDRNFHNDLESALLFFADNSAFRFTKSFKPALTERTLLKLGKFNYTVERDLRELELCESASGGGLWVHEEVAAIILAIGARHLAAMHEDTDSRLVTSTDFPKSMRFAFDPHVKSGGFRVGHRGEGRSYRCLELLLEGTLPTPGPMSSLADVIDFARRREDEVRHFRFEMNRMMSEIDQSEDPLEALRSCRERIDSAVRDLRRSSRQQLRLGFGTLAVLATTVAIGRNLSPETVRWVFDGFGVTAATAIIGTRLVRGRPEGNPYSYLLRAQEAFGPL